MTELSRRALLRGGVAFGSAVTLAGCSTPAASPRTTAADSTTPAASSQAGDLVVLAVAAALEDLAITAYGVVLAAVDAKRYDGVPAAFRAFVAQAAAHHTAHARAWEQVLTASGGAALVGAPLRSAAATLANVHAAASWTDAARSVSSIEQVAAATYVAATGMVIGSTGLELAATTAPVEAAHTAVLALLLGEDPVPATYLGVASALRTSALIL